MAKLSFDDGDGVWRTVGGKHIFIRTGQSLSDAMRESGKFKSSSKKPKIGDERDKKFNNYLNKYKDKTEGELRRIIHESNDETEKMSANKLLNDMKEEDKNIAKGLFEYEESKKELNLSQRQIEEGNRLNQKAENGAREDVKTFLSGKENYDGSREDFIRDLSNEWGISKEKAEEILHDENSKHPRNFTNNQQKSIEKNMPAGAKFSKTLEESNVKTFADEIKEMEGQSSKKSGEIKDFVKVSDGTYLPIREGETEAEVKKAYNERQEKYRRNLEPEVSKNLRDPRRLWDQDLVDTYIEMNEKGMVNEQKDKFTRNMKNMEGKPLYSPDRLKQETEEKNNNQSNDKFYTKKDGTKVYDPYKGTPYERKYDSLKDVVDDKDSKLNQYINEKIRRKAYQKYLREHPASKITFEDFKDMRNINK